MDWITPEIAIGNYLEARDAELLAAQGIASILNLDGNLDGLPEGTVRVIESCPLIDGPGNAPSVFQAAVAALERLVQTASPVLVHCHAGRGRSPVVVAGYLMRTRKLGPEEALDFVAARREISVTPELLRLLDYL